MKEEFLIIVIASLIVLGFSSLIYNYGDQGYDLTGLAIHDASLNESINEDLNETNITIITITEEDVLIAFNETKEIIEEMEENSFSSLYMKDSLIEAERVFEQAKNAEILRNESAPKSEKEEALKALELIDWEEISYESVLTLLDEIKERRTRAFLIYDTLGATKISLQGYVERGVDVSNAQEFLSQAETAFYEDRYEEAEDLLDAVKEDLKLQILAFSTLRTIQRSIKTFFEKYWEKYWYVMIVVLALISITIFFIYRKITEELLKRKIKKMKHKKSVLTDLMKKAQEDRFKKKKIPSITYNIRMKKYEQKLNEIKEELPVLETKLDKLTINMGYLKIEPLSHKHIKNEEPKINMKEERKIL